MSRKIKAAVNTDLLYRKFNINNFIIIFISHQLIIKKKQH